MTAEDSRAIHRNSSYPFWGFDAQNHALAEGIEGKNSHPGAAEMVELSATVALSGVVLKAMQEASPEKFKEVVDDAC